jgi:hypothetical protein
MEDEPTAPIPPAGSENSATTPTEVAEPAAAQPPPLSPEPQVTKPRRVVKIVGHRATGWFVAALLVGAVTGLSVALANAPSSPVRAVIGGPAIARPPIRFQVPAHAPNVFQVPAFGVPLPYQHLLSGIVGQVTSTSPGSFAVTTLSGSVVKVDEQSSTSYRSGANVTTKAAVKKGVEVFVFGTRSGSTVKASIVSIVPTRPNTFYLPG